MKSITKEILNFIPSAQTLFAVECDGVSITLKRVEAMAIVKETLEDFSYRMCLEPVCLNLVSGKLEVINDEAEVYKGLVKSEAEAITLVGQTLPIIYA
jgi:hypothetical protein